MPRADQWFDLIDRSRPSVVTALALASLGLGEKAQPAHFAKENWVDVPRDVRRLVMDELLRHGHVARALAIMDKLSPDRVRALGAAGDEMGLRDVFAEVVRMSFPGGTDCVEFAEAFAAVKHEGFAEETYALALRRLVGTSQQMPTLIKSYGRFLVERRRFEEAETMLLRHHAGVTEGLAELLVDLYRGWNRLNDLERELGKFHLPGAVRAQALYLAARPAGKK